MNSWRQMFRELEMYVREQTKDGRPWDGNVPTKYKIQVNTTAGGGKIGEEKSLGRWVNRQRTIFQEGKLKKDRQMDLERIGLKWSVLVITPWSTMYGSLCAYAEEKRKQNGIWDGYVHAKYKTQSNPPLNLGRWVNRQRSAHAEGRLTDEFVRKLEAVGLKWAVHKRKTTNEVGLDNNQGGFIQNKKQKRRTLSERIEELKSFYVAHGHVRPFKKNNDLCAFCSRLRHARRHPETSTMTLTEDHISALDALRFDWVGLGNQTNTKSFSDRIADNKCEVIF